MQFKKNKQQQSTNTTNATRHRVAASDQMMPAYQNNHNMRANFDRRSLVDVQKYQTAFSPNAAGKGLEQKTLHARPNYSNQQHQYKPSSNHIRSDSPSQFDELDIDEHHGIAPDEDFGELNEFEEQLIEPTEYNDMIQSINPQGAIGSDSYHTLQNKYNKKQTNSFAKTQSFAQAASNFSSPQSSTAMIQSQPMASVKAQATVQNESNIMVRHNRFQNLINSKHRTNNRQIKQVQTQKNSQVRSKINDELFSHGSPPTSQGKGAALRNRPKAFDNSNAQPMVAGMEKSELAKRQIQMIQNLPPSVVLNSTKTKLAGKSGAGILSKALSTHVSPSASSTSFIGQNNKSSQGGVQGGQVKINDAVKPTRETKGSGHGKYKQTSNSGYGRPTDFLNQQNIVQTAGTKLKIRKLAGDAQQYTGPVSQSNSLNRQKVGSKDPNAASIMHDQVQPYCDIKKERTFDGQVNSSIPSKYKQQAIRVNKDSCSLSGPQQKLKIKMQGSFQQNFSSQSSSSKMITGVVNEGNSINLAQSSGQLILFPNKRPLAATTVVSADPSPRAVSITAQPDFKNSTQIHVQPQKLTKHSKAAANASKQASKHGIPNSVPVTSLSTPVNFSPSAENGASKQRKVVVVGSRGTFQQQIHSVQKGSSSNQVAQGPQMGSKQQYRQSNNQQLRKILRNNLVSVQLGETEQGSTGRCADSENAVNKRNGNAGLALKNSYCPEAQQKFFDAQNSLGNALVSRTHQVNPAQVQTAYPNQQYLSMNITRGPQSSAGSKSGEGAPIQYKTVGSQGQPLSQQALKNALQTQQIFKQNTVQGPTAVTNPLIGINRANHQKKIKPQQQQQQSKCLSNKTQIQKQTQAKSFMLKEKDVQFSNQFQQLQAARLSISKQPPLLKSRDSSTDNVHLNPDDEFDLDFINANQDHNLDINSGLQSSFQQATKKSNKLQSDSYNSKMLNSMLRRNGDQEYSEDHNSNQPNGQSRAAATGLVTLKGFGTATGYRTAQVSAHVSAHASKNHSNNSSQVRPQQFSGTANQVGNKIFYHGPQSISGSITGANHVNSLGTQLQKHGQLGSTLKQQKKNSNTLNTDSHNSNQNTAQTNTLKKATVNSKKNMPGSISQEASEQNNYSGMTSGTTTILRKHGIVSSSNSKLNSFHSNQVTVGAVSRESSYKQKRSDKNNGQVSTTANRFKFDGSNRQSLQDDESSLQKQSRVAQELNQFKGTHLVTQTNTKTKQRTNSTTNKPQNNKQNKVAYSNLEYLSDVSTPFQILVG